MTNEINREKPNVSQESVLPINYLIEGIREETYLAEPEDLPEAIKPIRYLTYLGLNSHIFSNSNNKEEITGGQYVAESTIRVGNELLSGKMIVESKYKLRPIDDEVFMAVLSIFEDRGNFDVELPPRSDLSYDSQLVKNIAKARRVDGIHLNEICSRLGNCLTTTNRLTIIESLDILSSIKMKVTSHSGVNKDVLNKTHNYGLINETVFSKTESNMAGYITLSDKCIQDILEGKTSMFQLNVILKLPRGKPRSYFKYIHSVLSDEVRHVVKLDHLFHTVIGYTNNPVQARKNMQHFNDQSKIFEDWKILLPGFSLPNHQREYNLIFKGKDGLKYVDLRQGPYFLNPSQYPIPKMNTTERQRIVKELSEIGGLNDKYITLYLGAISGQVCKPIEEKNNGAGEFKIKKILSVDPNGGLIIDFPDQEEPSKRINITWEFLRTILNFIKLFKKYNPKRHNYTGGVLLRKSIEEGMFYNIEEHKKYEEMETIEEQAKISLKEKNERSIILEKKKETEEKERIKKEEEEKIMIKEFNQISVKFRMNFDIETNFMQNIITKVVGRPKTVETWFKTAQVYSINKEIVIVVNSVLARDWIHTKYCTDIKSRIQEYGYDDIHVLTVDGYMDQFRDAVSKVNPDEMSKFSSSDARISSVDPNKISVEESRKKVENVDNEIGEEVISLFKEIIKFDKAEMIHFIRSIGNSDYKLKTKIEMCIHGNVVIDERSLKKIISANFEIIKDTFYGKVNMGLG